MLTKLMPVARVKVLAFLLLNASEEYHLREIARRAGVPLRAVQRELALLEEIALVERHRRGRQVFVAVQTSHPLYADLRSLLVRSEGLVVPLREAIEALEEVEAAAVYGSVAASSDTGRSDIEVTPDRGHALVILDLRARGDSPVTVDVDGLAAGVGDNRVLPIGAAPFSPSNFSSFAGFVSGWKIVSDAEGRQVKMGRDSEAQPIELTVDPGVQVSIVYIVPEEGQPMVVTLPGAGGVSLVPSS
jgi:DNA-binding transcriptional ArsR family regulator